MNKDTLYLVEIENAVLEVNLHYQITHQKRVKKLFEECCLFELSTLKGRQEAIKILFDYKYNIPIYINQYMLFIKVRSRENLWINCPKICSIIKTKEGTDIIFPSGKILKTNANYRTLKTSYQKALNILNYKNDFI